MEDTTEKKFEITTDCEIAVRSFGEKGTGIVSRLKFSDDGIEWRHHVLPGKKGFSAGDNLYPCKISWNEFHEAMKQVVIAQRAEGKT